MGERFKILDSAPVPDQPAGPNRLLISLAGLAVGVLGGEGVAAAMEMMDQSVRSEHEAAELLGIPVLAGIPQIYTRAQKISRHVRLVLAILLTASCSGGFGLVVSIVTRKMGIF